MSETMQIEQFLCLSDNFAVLLHDEKNGKTALIDAPDAIAVEQALKRRGWSLDYILLTHHHHDHIDGVAALKMKYQAFVIGPEREKDKIPLLDHTVKQGDKLSLLGDEIEIIETPGHTLGAVCYYFTKQKIVFTGDTLFSLGCGRLFEGTAPMMFESLAKLAKLPKDTSIYCGHDYTLSNARFALSIEPHNQALQKRAKAVEALSKDKAMTLPISLQEELETNPFLRCNSPEIRQNLGLEYADAAIVFAEMRKRKDHF